MSEPRTALAVLEEMAATLRKLLAREEANGRLLEQFVKGAPTAQASNSAPARAGGQIASDRDLDGQYGDPSIRKMPKGWEEDDFTGFRFSETRPEFLDFLAKDLAGLAEWLRGKGEPDKAKYKELDAARARGWAKRLRAGYVPTARPAAEDEGPSL